jgi:hypothetical protein
MILKTIVLNVIALGVSSLFCTFIKNRFSMFYYKFSFKWIKWGRYDNSQIVIVMWSQ